MINFKGFTPYPEEFARQYRKQGFWKDKTISQIMEESFNRFSGNTILISDSGRRYSYEEFGKLVTRLALHFHILGLKEKDRVVLQLPNVPEVLIACLAIIKAGGIPIMALPPHQEAEIGYFTQFAAARAIVIPDLFKKTDKQAMAANIMAQKNSPLEMAFVLGDNVQNGFHSIDALLKDPIEKRENPDILPQPDPDMPALLQLSGGTTGVPKLIPRTHNDYVHNFTCNADMCELNQNTRMLIAIPQEHNFALACPGFMGLVTQGGCQIISQNPSPKAALSLIQEHKITHWVAVPAMIISLLNYQDRNQFDLSSLEVILTGGSKLNPEVAVRIGKELHCDLQQVLGMGEGPLFWTRKNDPQEIKLDTQGRPQSKGEEFRIVDPITEEDMPDGDVGELWCRGPHTIRGYYNVPEHNLKAFSDDGFYKSGDLVRLHPSGNIIVEGRIKDCINRGGEKISAEEVENHILAHINIDNCSCVSMPDPVLGEKTCVFVTLKNGASINLNELNSFLENERRIAIFKMPERLEILDELPLTNVGKVDKKTLRDRIARQLAFEAEN
ncbi:(2,3-dihydroxybenzoyl)adenylate synthase [Desulfobacula phenolica]|uniref:2,3-dihydroxybenzoate-AMP ligase n=1 Tax=Desulfobacula phenolica TaxID=90732 RepID=A0A1H2IUS3_9BACT|nr:AMP-binding protein [Desulfobacula phenolica]SDU47822.1 2,3-dihydroxybenzoate-AMP ligase [Desulfobacula phenolica]